MLGISTRGEGAHVIRRCLSTSVLSGWRSIMEFFWGVWKLASAQGRWGLPSLTHLPWLNQLTSRLKQQHSLITAKDRAKGEMSMSSFSLPLLSEEVLLSWSLMQNKVLQKCSRLALACYKSRITFNSYLIKQDPGPERIFKSLVASFLHFFHYQ